MRTSDEIRSALHNLIDDKVPETDTIKPIKVLLVDNDVAEAHLLRLFLGMSQVEKYEVTTVRTLSVALAHLGTDGVDLVLMDMELPDASGVEAFLTAHEHNSSVPYILLANQNDTDAALKAARHGAQDYLIKGQVDYDLLSRTIRYAIERKRTEEMLRDIDRAKTEFISLVSHELRTPLHSVIGMLNLILQGKVEDSETQKEFLTIASDQSKHLANLIDDLLDASSIEAGVFSIHREYHQLHNVIVKAVQSVNGLALQKQVIIRNQVSSSLDNLFIDGERIMQVILNLLSNAIKFSDQNSVVTVSASVSNEDMLVAVEDTGPGIPSEYIDQLFDRFYRMDNSLTRNTGGSGLGLYITRQIVEAHGGNIWAESTLDQGSTFSFTIPIVHTENDATNSDGVGPQVRLHQA